MYRNRWYKFKPLKDRVNVIKSKITYVINLSIKTNTVPDELRASFTFTANIFKYKNVINQKYIYIFFVLGQKKKKKKS